MNVWATSMPTDIALALGVLSLLGKRVQPEVRLFLLTLAIADDLFSLVVLGIYYGNALHPEKAIATLGAAAYSRYLPRSVSSKSVVGWTVFGASIVPIVLVIYGAALSGSSKELSDAIAMDPIGALTSLLPTWFLIPFALVAKVRIF